MIAAELRLGNWVNTIVSDKPSIVTFIKSQKVKDGYYQSIELDEEEIYIPQHICGIPLTADILERAGFNRDSEGWYLSADNKLYDPLELNGVGSYSQRNTTIFAFKHGSSILKRGVKYVHQLQNLYHALTGEELTINLLSESAAR